MAEIVSTGAGAARYRADGPSSGFAAELAHVAIGLSIAAVMIFAPVAAHGVHPGLGILTTLFLAGICAWRLPQIAVVAIVFSFLFQNLFVSLMTGFIQGEDDFDIIRAYNFLLLCTVWLVIAALYLARWNRRPRGLDPYVRASFAVLVAIGLYFLVGFVFNGMTAVIYLRNIVTPVLFFQICLVLFASQPVKLTSMLTSAGVLAMLCGYFEFLNRDTWLYWTNGYAYWELASGPNWATLAYDKMAAETGVVASRLTDTFTIDFFNSPLVSGLGIEMMRIFGPNMHAISFAYALSFFTMFTLYRGRFLLAALFFVLAFLCNAKGPLILMLLAMASWAVFRLFGARLAFALHALALAGYAVIGVVLGLRMGDYHVLGLMSALHEFPLNPIGHGIGSGGNLSPSFELIDWPTAQATGRTLFPVESSIGVLMYQMGIAAFGIVAFYCWTAWRVMTIARETGNSLHAAAALSLLVMVTNGLFQEEAFFSPLALALYLGIAGMILGAAVRTGLDLSRG